VKAEYGERKQSEAEGEHGRHFRPEDVHADTFQICAPQDNQRVSQRLRTSCTGTIAAPGIVSKLSAQASAPQGMPNMDYCTVRVTTPELVTW
jgi:hypothetical protein